MKFWASSHTFEHPWSTVTQAFWRKYPNDYQSVVNGTDVIERFISEDGKLHSKRLIISDWKIPSFMKIFFSDIRGYAVEYSVVDPVEKTLTLKSQNINAASLFTMREEIVYRAHNDMTQLQHEAKIIFDSHISRYIDQEAENWTASTLTDAAHLGLRAMDSIIEKVEEETYSTFQAIDNFSFADTINSVDSIIDSSIGYIDSSIDYIDSSIDSIKQDVECLTDSLKHDAETLSRAV